MPKKILKITSTLSPEEFIQALKLQTEEKADFNYTTTGKNEDRFFLGVIGKEKIHLKKNVFESQPVRRRHTLECKGRVEAHGSGCKATFTLTYFAAQSSINNIGTGIFLFCLCIIPFSYDSTNLIRIVLAEALLLLIMAGLIWSSRRTFKKLVDEMEGKLMYRE